MEAKEIAFMSNDDFHRAPALGFAVVEQPDGSTWLDAIIANSQNDDRPESRYEQDLKDGGATGSVLLASNYRKRMREQGKFSPQVAAGAFDGGRGARGVGEQSSIGACECGGSAAFSLVSSSAVVTFCVV